MIRRFIAAASTFCVAVGAILTLSPAASGIRDIRTEDRNGDGRPDVWRTYDRHGRLTEVALDTNFDGRSDVYEFYQGGNLIRRDSDRNFNDRVDLVEDFDPETHDHVRSIVDVDFDGVADLLVLFQGGRPVFSKWAHTDPSYVAVSDIRDLGGSRRGAGAALAPLADPFRGDLTMRRAGLATGSDACVGLASSGGLPSPLIGALRPLIVSSRLGVVDIRPDSLAVSLLRASRGPPAAIL